METSIAANRRQFLQGTTAAGLVIAFNVPGAKRAAAAPAVTEFAPNAFLRISPDNTVTVICKHIEFGQGPYTGVATVIADELDADWAQIKVESAPADAKLYANSAFGIQGTGGSTAMFNSWDQLRKAGSEARARIIAAAAETWKIDPSQITIEKGVVKGPSGKSATLGDLANAAQEVVLKGEPKPKDAADWRFIGKHVAKVDTLPKTNGTAMYTIDVKMPNMLTCLLLRPSRPNAKAGTYDPAAALAVPGVKEVVTVPQGVAVLADGYWAARKGRDALKITWDESGTESRSTRELMSSYATLAKTTGAIAPVVFASVAYDDMSSRVLRDSVPLSSHVILSASRPLRAAQ